MGLKGFLRHLSKIDHIAFLLILPSLFINTWMAVALWAIALFYDVYEYVKVKR